MSKSKIPQMLKDARQRADAILAEIEDLTGRDHLTPEQAERLSRQVSAGERLHGEIEDLTGRDHLTPEQAERLSRQVSAGERLHGEIEALEASSEEFMREAVANGWVGSGSDEGPAFVPDQRAWQDPITPRSTKNDLEYRAMRALDTAPDVDRERIEKLVRSEDGRNDAEYVIVASDPHYRTAFTKMIRDPQFGHLGLTPEEQRSFANAQNSEVRAAMTTTGANGGFLIPFHLDPTVMLSNAGASNPFRQIARVQTLSNSNVWHGINSAGVTAEWVSEAAEATDASPTFSQPSITPVRADAYVQASYEVVQDSNIGDQLATLFADAKDRLEATAFATGTGVTQPLGIVTALAAITASRVAAQTNASFADIDLFNMSDALPARAQGNAAWVGGRWLYNRVRRFVGTNSQPYWVDLGPGTPGSLLGYPAYESSAMLNAAGSTGLSAATASSDDVLVLADWAKSFCIVDRTGSLLVTDPMVKGANRRPSGEYGFFYFWRVGSGLLDGGNSARLLRI